MFSVPEFIGGNVLIHPPIKTLDVLGIPIDRRKCIDDSSNNRGLEAPKSRPGRSKIEPRALQDTIFETRLT